MPGALKRIFDQAKLQAPLNGVRQEFGAEKEDFSGVPPFVCWVPPENETIERPNWQAQDDGDNPHAIWMRLAIMKVTCWAKSDLQDAHEEDHVQEAENLAERVLQACHFNMNLGGAYYIPKSMHTASADGSLVKDGAVTVLLIEFWIPVTLPVEQEATITDFPVTVEVDH